MPLRLAVTTAVWLAAICPAVAVKLPVSAPCTSFSFRLAGTVSNALLLESVAVPAEPPEAITVHVADAAEVRAVGEQVSEDTNADAERTMLAVAELLL